MNASKPMSLNEIEILSAVTDYLESRMISPQSRISSQEKDEKSGLMCTKAQIIQVSIGGVTDS